MTSWLYHSEKSCARVGSFSSAMRRFVRSSQRRSFRLSKLKSVADRQDTVNEGALNTRRLPLLVGNLAEKLRIRHSSCPSYDFSRCEVRASSCSSRLLLLLKFFVLAFFLVVATSSCKAQDKIEVYGGGLYFAALVGGGRWGPPRPGSAASPP